VHQVWESVSLEEIIESAFACWMWKGTSVSVSHLPLQSKTKGEFEKSHSSVALYKFTSSVMFYHWGMNIILTLCCTIERSYILSTKHVYGFVWFLEYMTVSLDSVNWCNGIMLWFMLCKNWILNTVAISFKL